MKHIDNIFLYNDHLGQEIKTPVLQTGSGSPHVLLVALQHGWEIIGLDTAFRALEKKDFTGKVTLISVASPMAFADGTRLSATTFGPSTKLLSNFNRLHPGDNRGNIFERSASNINEYIKKVKPDFIIDLHSYSSQSMPHAIVDNFGGENQKNIEKWVTLSQIPWYLEYDEETFINHSLEKSLSAIWAKRNTPSITLELGPIGAFSVAQSKNALLALENLLISAKVKHGEIINCMDKIYLNRRFQRQEITYQGDKGGYLRPSVDVNSIVKKNQEIAKIINLNGKIEDTILAKNDGIMFIWHNEHRVLSGSLLGVFLVEEKNL